MDLNEYQHLAARTMNRDLSAVSVTLHALHGMSAEVGELHGIYQKAYQGHEVNAEALKKVSAMDERYSIAGYDEVGALWRAVVYRVGGLYHQVGRKSRGR